MATQASVLAAVDFSERSPAVVDTGARLARRLGGRCVVLHAVEALTGEEDPSMLLPVLRRQVEQVRVEARADLAALLAAVPPEGVDGELAEGSAALAIVARTRAAGARLVVVGGPSHGHLLGSTAERVVRRSPVAVLVVRRPPPDGRYRTAVLGVDFSEGAGRAWDAASEVLEPETRRVACHVLNTWGLPRSEDLSAGRRDLEGQVAAWVRGRPGGGAAQIRVETGSPKAVLLEVAREEGADLLVVGRQGRAGLARFLLGSVAEAAARRAACDVLVVGAPGEVADPP